MQGTNALAIQADYTKNAHLKKLLDEMFQRFLNINIDIKTMGLLHKTPIVEIVETINYLVFIPKMHFSGQKK